MSPNTCAENPVSQFQHDAQIQRGEKETDPSVEDRMEVPKVENQLFFLEGSSQS